MNKYTIREDLADSYVKREALKKIRIIIAVFFVVLIILYGVTVDLPAIRKIFPMVTGMFCLVGAVIYIASLTQLKNTISVTEFEIDEQTIAKTLNREKLNLVNKIGMARNERRYGVSYEQTIQVSTIKETIIGENEISVRAFRYDFFSGDGKIDIPKELDGFDKLKAMIIEKGELYKVKRNL